MATANDTVEEYNGTIITITETGGVYTSPAPSVHTHKLPGFMARFSTDKLQRIENAEALRSPEQAMIRTGCWFEPWGAGDAAEDHANQVAQHTTTQFVKSLLPSIHSFLQPDATPDDLKRWMAAYAVSPTTEQKATQRAVHAANAIYTAISRSAIARFVVFHSLYFSPSPFAALSCLVDPVAAPDGVTMIARALCPVALPTGADEHDDNPYVAFARTPDAGIQALVQAALAELTILATGHDSDAPSSGDDAPTAATSFANVLRHVAEGLAVHGPDTSNGDIALRWDAIHTLRFATDSMADATGRALVRAFLVSLAKCTEARPVVQDDPATALIRQPCHAPPPPLTSSRHSL
jgi:hypothetical protein